MLHTDDFDYKLPPEQVADRPVENRDESRLLVLQKNTGAIDHRIFRDLPNLLRPGDCLVLNDSRVLAARLIGRRERGGKAELLLIEPLDESRWRAWVKPARKIKPGTVVRVFAEGDDEGAAVRVEEELAEGERAVSLESGRDFESFVDRYGRMPVPPYILSARKSRLKRALYSASDVEPDWDEIEGESQRELLLDRERYQTIFARRPGSVAAPTAGLHFTESLMDALRIKRIEIRYVTLHVGPGTFAPVKTDDPTQHPMHRERFSIEETNARAIESARRDPDRRIVAVGTTVVRVLETLVRDHGAIRPGAGATDLLILPGFAFRAIDALITNFHLPRSTLLMLVSAWAGRERILSAYEEAIRMGYRFYSYGDAMLIE